MTAAGSNARHAATLANHDLRLVCEPDLGARLVSLVDRTSGREWLTQPVALQQPAGSTTAWDAPDATFGAEQAFGWDECLPTIARCEDPLDRSGPLLRDHGDLWGRPALVEFGPPGLATVWRVAERFELRRLIRLDGRVVAVTYALRSLGPAVPFLWSMHPLLAVDPGGRVELPARQRVRLTHAAGIAFAAGADRMLEWPVATTADDTPFDLSLVREETARIALKLALAPAPDRVVVRQPDGAAITIEWDRALAPALGLWLDYGGWPAGDRLCQLGIEPATSVDEDLATALDAGRAAHVPAGGEVTWWVRLSLLQSHGMDR
ncbi:MAG: hypothetical protein M3Y88_03480 [Chloroflexota bacterium]|nr:hypothetical protein [Chloroflexota bacterium]